MPVPRSAFHWQPVRSTNRIALRASRAGTRGRWHPSGWALPSGSNGSIRSQSSSGTRQPSSLTTSPMMTDTSYAAHARTYG
jgi:hypothetical protein